MLVGDLAVARGCFVLCYRAFSFYFRDKYYFYAAYAYIFTERSVANK